ncbi:uncharacterized protein LOC129302594 [Prosopis cineraria]|uniref:uncharacterized protein LOC129302594 n=1 Tax=Prosopis cineraria TaxID=364024 RepID=UPI00240FB4C6|nr:uncharacterized protein LOC129302594 [Prosopis cineraria]
MNLEEQRAMEEENPVTPPSLAANRDSKDSTSRRRWRKPTAGIGERWVNSEDQRSILAVERKKRQIKKWGALFREALAVSVSGIEQLHFLPPTATIYILSGPQDLSLSTIATSMAVEVARGFVKVGGSAILLVCGFACLLSFPLPPPLAVHVLLSSQDLSLSATGRHCRWRLQISFKAYEHCKCPSAWCRKIKHTETPKTYGVESKPKTYRNFTTFWQIGFAPSICIYICLTELGAMYQNMSSQDLCLSAIAVLLFVEVARGCIKVCGSTIIACFFLVFKPARYFYLVFFLIILFVRFLKDP